MTRYLLEIEADNYNVEVERQEALAAEQCSHDYLQSMYSALDPVAEMYADDITTHPDFVGPCPFVAPWQPAAPTQEELDAPF